MDAVVHFTEVTSKSILASARITRFISSELGLEIMDVPTTKADKYGTLIVVNSPFAFCSWRETAKELIQKADRVIWVQNDYDIQNPTKRKPDEIWSTVEQPGAEYINWNCLTFSNEPPTGKKKFVDGIMYYGAYRKGRENDFTKYLKGKAYPVYISSSAKGAKNFFGLLKHDATYFPVFQNPQHIGIFGATIYMEDAASHKTYMSPANRFYECLSAGVAMGIDPEAAHTLIQAGMQDVDKFIVHNEQDVLNLITNHAEIAAQQYKLWAKDYRAELKERLRELWRG